MAEEQARLAEERARVAELETSRAQEQVARAETDKQRAELDARNRRRAVAGLSAGLVALLGLSAFAGMVQAAFAQKPSAPRLHQDKSPPKT